MLRRGTLHENDRVRMEHGTQWTPARDVVGLVRAAGVQSDGCHGQLASRADESLTDGPPAPPARQQGQPGNTNVRHSDKRAQSPYRLVWPFGLGRPSSANAHFPSEEGCRAEDDDHSSAPVPRPALSSLFRSVFVCGLIGICGLAIAVRMYRFWIQKGGADKAAAVRVVHHERRPIETLQQGVPELIPGLEDVGPGFSPCLTPDLRTIVFSNTGNPETAYDLYLAERKDASACFGQPRLIKSCASVETDAYPTLTADGLELFFVRSDSRPEFYHARRASPSADFGDPVLWSVPAIPGADAAQLRIERPQFLDPLRLLFCAVDLGDNSRRCFMAKRADRKGLFASLQEVRFSDLGVGSFVSENGLHAFSGDERGLFVCVRNSTDEPFGVAVQLLDATVTGPIDGPIWVASKESVIFYSSPGPGKELVPWTNRKLWMVRF